MAVILSGAKNLTAGKILRSQSLPQNDNLRSQGNSGRLVYISDYLR